MLLYEEMSAASGKNRTCRAARTEGNKVEHQQTAEESTRTLAKEAVEGMWARGWRWAARHGQDFNDKTALTVGGRDSDEGPNPAVRDPKTGRRVEATAKLDILGAPVQSNGRWETTRGTSGPPATATHRVIER